MRGFGYLAPDIPQGWKHRGIPVRDKKQASQQQNKPTLNAGWSLPQYHKVRVVHFASVSIPDMGSGEDVSTAV